MSGGSSDETFIHQSGGRAPDPFRDGYPDNGLGAGAPVRVLGDALHVGTVGNWDDANDACILGPRHRTLVLGIRWLITQGRGPRGGSPLDILNKRYARGELTKEEFEAKKRDIA